MVIMALIKCPECKKKISDQCGKCPNCGYPIEIAETPVESLDNEAINNKVAVEEKTDKPNRERKPINKKLLISIISVIIILLTVGGILGYNALLPRINATKDFKAAVKFVEQKNTELETEISQSEELIAKKQPLLDGTLLSTLENAISDAKAVKITDFKTPKKVEDIISRTKELNKIDYSEAIANLNDKHTALEINAKRYQLVNAPTEAYVIQCLKTIPEITGISAVTEDNDPNGNLNKAGGYTATVYFSHKSVNQKDVYGDTLIDKGTDAGGGIEVYTCVEDAVKRRDYLATFDGSILASGTHTVIGTVLIRTSNELTASQQKDFETKLIAALTYIEEVDNKKEPTLEDKPAEITPTTTAPTTQQNNQQTSSKPKQEPTKSQKELAIEAAYKYRDDNKDTILSVYELYEHLNSLGYSDAICEEVCFTEKIVGFYDCSAVYDYERIIMFHSLGYSRQAIINFYDGFASDAEIEYLVDECLAGRKLTYEYIDDELQLVEHD